MLFGLQAAGQMQAAQIAAAHARLQDRMERDPSVTTMQPGGQTVLPPPAFVNGPGGTRLTPDQAADEHRRGRQLMAAGMDTSPVGHWTQGAARVAQALVGSMEEGRALKADEANAAEGGAVAKALIAPFADTDPAARDAMLLGAATNRYIDPIVRNLAANERERLLKERAPDYFMSGGDRVKYDPTSGQSSVIYDAPEEFQTYATSMGYQPGTPEYQTAAQDYVLRGNGPTAYGFDVGLEGERQSNRVALEGQRYSNRLALRGTPTYSDLHPRPRATGGGGGGSPSRPPSMAGTMAPLLAKVARGEQLSPAEQTAWNMYRPPSRGGKRPSAAAALVASGGADGAAPVRIKSREEYAKLPAGASFIDPNGVQRVKGGGR